MKPFDIIALRLPMDAPECIRISRKVKISRSTVTRVIVSHVDQEVVVLRPVRRRLFSPVYSLRKVDPIVVSKSAIHTRCQNSGKMLLPFPALQNGIEVVWRVLHSTRMVKPSIS